jgi:hypothetical protein
VKASDSALVQSALLALWLGSAFYFVVVVAPAAFAALPSRELAGVLVGRLLPALFLSGVVVGVCVLLLEWSVGRRMSVTPRASAGLVVALSCAIAQFVIAPRIESVRKLIDGGVDALPANDVRRIAFGRLHGLSVLWLGVAVVAAAIAFGLALRAQRNRA